MTVSKPPRGAESNPPTRSYLNKIEGLSIDAAVKTLKMPDKPKAERVAKRG